MNPIVFNIIAVISGIVVGSAVNMLIVYYGPFLIPPPEGVDTTTAEGLKAGMHLMKPIHYVVPFVAHFAGTFAGAFVACRIAVTHKMKFAFGIGFLFLLGGVAASFMIPAPAWFIATDLLLAYIPAAWLAGRLVEK
jgi:hypothetical protein